MVLLIKAEKSRCLLVIGEFAVSFLERDVFNAFENVEYLAVLFTSPVDIMIIYLQSMHVGVEIVYSRVIRRLRS